MELVHSRLASLKIVFVCSLLLCAACGEPMHFENAGSKQALVQDEAACNQELSQSSSGVAYAQATQVQVDPLQVCIERKGWKRVPSSSNAPGSPGG
jgi:hypothetical protein